MKKMNMVIAQSGGPSMVINQSLVGAVLEARKSPKIGRILGARHGILGILGNDYIDLRKPSAKKLEAIAETPSSALGSCRRKPDAADCRAIFEAFRKLNVGYFFYIGGNDSADAARIVARKRDIPSSSTTSRRRSTTICAPATTRPASGRRQGSSRARSAATTWTTGRLAA